MQSGNASAYYDLGNYRRAVSTSSNASQTWFERGLNWCYGYHHEESMRCFRRAAEQDPNCAMAYWGLAYAAGPNYNKPWEAFLDEERAVALGTARDAVLRALEVRAHASPVETALIEALEQRYPVGPEALDEGASGPFADWNDAYAAAMRGVYERFPDDPDVATLFAEALINRTPWQLWDITAGVEAPGADTHEAMVVLEKAIAAREDGDLPSHPGLLHMLIHVLEMSPHPERALRACDALRDLVPDAGHLRHMPSHVDVLCGNYYDAMVANEKAMAADERYFANEPGAHFYSLYRCHDIHFLIYAAMFLGQLKPALRAAAAMEEALPESLLRVENPPMADWLEGFLSMKVHVLVRFGRWHDLLAEPLPPDPELYAVTTAMLHYGKAIAHASLGDVAAADEERAKFARAVERVPESRTVFNNTCQDILLVAREMMLGELEYRRGNYEVAFEHLRRSAELDDSLPYDEPWAWMQPVRHALGALLLEQGNVEEAYQVYRDDLGLTDNLPRACQHPDNVWSLQGYVECLERLGREDEAQVMRPRLALAKARADVAIEASCFCRLEKHPCH